MEKTNKIIASIASQIEGSISGFNSSTPEIQARIYNKIQLLLKDLEIKNGRLANTVKNIKAISRLKNEIESVILNKGYIDSVTEFAKGFEAVTLLQHSYFKALESEFTPAKVLDAIKQDAIKATVISLTEAGISANVTEPVINLLRSNITTGGTFAELSEQVRTFIKGNEDTLGALERYTSQITTDALNQYSATYNHVVAEDLGLEWYQYIGSNLETTRPFCKALTGKRWVHKTELPQILKGHIDSTKVAINPKTGVWYGGIAGTNVTNFPVNRGGWNCGHQLYPVSDALVPEDVKAKVKL